MSREIFDFFINKILTQIITATPCISSMRSIVYHQHAVLYLIKPQEYAPSVMIYAFGDDIHANA